MNTNKVEQIYEAIEKIQGMLSNKTYSMSRIEAIYSVVSDIIHDAEFYYYNLPPKLQCSIKGKYTRDVLFAMRNVCECLEAIEADDSLSYKRAMLEDALEYLKEI